MWVFQMIHNVYCIDCLPQASIICCRPLSLTVLFSQILYLYSGSTASFQSWNFMIGLDSYLSVWNLGSHRTLVLLISNTCSGMFHLALGTSNLYLAVTFQNTIPVTWLCFSMCSVPVSPLQAPYTHQLCAVVFHL